MTENSEKIRDFYIPAVGGTKKISEKYGNGFRYKIVQVKYSVFSNVGHVFWMIFWIKLR